MSVKQIVKRTEPYKFSVWWNHLPEVKIYMDWRPLIQSIAPKNHCVLVHWQPIPRLYRRFGMYDSATDMYWGVDYDKVVIETKESRLWQIPDQLFPNTRPTAVIVYDNAVIDTSTLPNLTVRPVPRPYN